MKIFSPKMPFIWILIIIISFFACATRPKNVKRKNESPTMYQSYTCDEINQELFVVDYKISELNINNNRQAKDLREFSGMPCLLPFNFVVSENYDEEIQKLKGDYQALLYVAKQKNCNLNIEPEK